MERTDRTPAVDIVILAAGRSSRMGGANKLLAPFGGVPLVRRSAMTALGTSARRVRVVVGHMQEEIGAALEGLDLDVIDNPRFAAGLSTSLIAGFDACCEAPEGPPDAVLVMLCDQPLLTSQHLDAMIAAAAELAPEGIVVATDEGVPFNPVVLSASLRGEVDSLTGDVGAKRLMARHAATIRTVELGVAASLDIDTPAALSRVRELLASAR